MRRQSKMNTRETEIFVPTIAAEIVLEDHMTTAVVKGRRILLTRHQGDLYAFDSACPHAAADLAKGSLRRGRICCREHDYCFDVRTGRIRWPEDEVYRLRRYEVREAGGVIMIRIDQTI